MIAQSSSSQDLLDAILQEKRIIADLESSGTLWEASSLSLLQKCHEENAHLLDRFLTLYGCPTPAQFGAEIHEAACLIAAQAPSLPGLQFRFLTCLHGSLKRYNIALLALEKDPYIQEAQRLFSKTQENYILGDKSFPHITLCQFYADEITLEDVLKDLKKVKSYPLPNFTGISFLKESPTSRWWVELSVLPTESLLHLRRNIISLLERHKIVPLNAPETSYRPHLTLARISSQEIKPFQEDLLTERPFTLALGDSDFFGQFVKIQYAATPQKS